MLRGLHAAEDISGIQMQLEDIYGVTVVIEQRVGVIGDEVHDIKDQMYDIKSSVDYLKAIREDHAIASSVETMPIPPTIFIGRDAVVSKIADHLVSGEIGRSRVFILAPGGMGKTSTALAVMKHPSVMTKFAKEHQFWVPCISANSPSTFLAHLSRHLCVTRQTDHPLNDILATLKTTDEPRVILLDNFETPWNPVEGKQESVRDVLRALALLPHIAILVTMRSEFPPIGEWTCEPLYHVEPQDSRRIYTTIDPSAGNDPKLKELLEVLGHLPYAVTLMATLGKRSLSSPERLLQRWNETGTGMLSKGQSGMDHSIELSLQFVANSPNAVMLLQVLSMLPAGLNHSHLDFWVPSWQPESVDALRDAALVLVIAKDTGSVHEQCLFVIPVVQSYMNQHDRIPDDIRQGVYSTSCHFLELHKSLVKGPNDPEFKRDIAAIGAQVINIQALITEIIQDEIGPHHSPSTSSQLTKGTHSVKSTIHHERLDALLTFAWYQRWTKAHTLVTEYALKLAKSVNDVQRTADAVSCLGFIFLRQNQIREGCTRLDEAKDLFSALGNDFRAFHSEMESIKAAGNYLDKYKIEQRLSQFKSHWNSRPHSAEISALMHLCSGEMHFYFKNAEKALEELQEARTLLVGLNYHYDVARCLFMTARCLGSLEQYHRALEVVDEAICLYEQVGLPDDRGIFNKVRYLKGADIWGEQLNATLKIALERSQALGKPLNTARVLRDFGELYVRRKDWAAARLAYQELIRELEGFSDHTSSAYILHSQNNLLYIDAQETNCSDSCIEFQTPPRF